MPKSDQRSKGDKTMPGRGGPGRGGAGQGGAGRGGAGRGGEVVGRSRKGSGRATPKAAKQNASGRYTPPIPREKRKSPAWHGAVLLFLLVGGLLVIVLNYVGVLPGGVHNYYLIIGILAMVVGLVMATFYH